jgi:hypothetical protein
MTNFDKESIINIVNFITTITANVPIQHDISRVNKGIRSYNKKLLAITKHKQVALIEIHTYRKYHT